MIEPSPSDENVSGRTPWPGLLFLGAVAVLVAVVATEPWAAAVQAAARSPGPAAGATVPEWMSVDRDARRVRMTVVAGRDETNNRWNFNGYSKGNATITVPVGYEVIVEFRNADPAVTHSLGIDEKPETWPAVFKKPTPVFEGAISPNATSLSGATKKGERETITFTAGQAGEYVLVCYVPGHASAGMWVWFHVSAEGKAGFAAPVS